MLELRHDTGVQEISINGKVTVLLNLTDIDFIERVFNAFDAMDKQQDKYQAMLAGENDAKKIFAAARAMDGEMRELINGLFGFDVCTPLYGTMNTYAMADGLPVWCNLMLCLIDNMNDTFTAEKKKTNPKADCLLSICDALDITPEQLLTGKGIDPEYKDADMDYEVTRSDIKILKQIHSLGDEQYKRLMVYMKALQKLEQMESIVEE